MSLPRRAKKIGENQRAIVGNLRKLPGVAVVLDHDDLLVGYNLMTYWFEIKNPNKVSKVTGKLLRSALKPSQRQILNTWTGHYSVVTSYAEIVEEIGYPRES